MHKRPDVIVHIGDHWDMPSLSGYEERGSAHFEGRRYTDDIESGKEAMEALLRPIRRQRSYKPRLVFCIGNHEQRLERAMARDPVVAGSIMGYEDFELEKMGWEVHDFLEPVVIDGVAYSHYFYNPMTGRPYGGQNIDTRLKTIGHSFTMGHQQGLGYGLRDVLGKMQHGLVAGSCYLHDEDYKGPQGNAHWRGIVVCNQVENGSYDPMFVSLDYLCRRFEGVRLSEFMEGLSGGEGR